MKQSSWLSLVLLLAMLIAAIFTHTQNVTPAPTASVGPEALRPDSINKWVDSVYNAVFDAPAQQRDSLLARAIQRIYWKDTLPANGRLHHYMGYVLKARGRYVQSIPYYETAIRIHERIGHVSETPGSALYKPLANVYTRQGDNEKAEHLLRIALDSAAHRGERVEFLYELGKVYVNRQQDSIALGIYQQALDSTRISDPALLYPDDRAYWLSMIYNDMATCLLRMGRTDDALRNIGEALRFARNTRGVWALEKTGGALQTMGDIYVEKNDLPAAGNSFREALVAVDSFYKKIAEKKLNRECAKVRLALARTEHLMGNHEAALRWCQDAIRDVLPEFAWQNTTDQPPLGAFYSENVLLEAQQQKAEIFYAQFRQQPERRQLDHVTASLDLALAAADSLSTYQQYEEARLLALGIEYPATELMIQAQWELHNRFQDADAPARAFAYAERKKAAVLRQKKAYEKALHSANPALAQRYYSTLETISELHTETKENPGDAAIQSRLAAARETLVGIKKEIAQLQQGSSDLSALTAAKVQERLENGSTTLVEYFYSPNYQTLFGWGIDKNNIRFEKLRYDRDTVRRFRENLDNSPYWGGRYAFGAFVRQSHSLFTEVVKPLTAGQLPQNLIVSPDDALYGIPFDILLPTLPADTVKQDYNALPYLLHETVVRITPSATLALTPSGDAGNSEYARSYLGVAPYYSGYDNWLDSVRYSAGCIRKVKQQFAVSDTLVGAGATVESFKKQSPGYDVIHFYGHAGVNNRDGQSRMALTRLKSGAAPAAADISRSLDFSGAPEAFETTILKEDELLALPLKARLVVLSACETGVGDYQTGEGIMSLGRSFYYAGCASTVLSLWKLDDEATARITEYFFNNLAEGMNKDEALRQAKQTYLKALKEEGNTMQLSPNFWAGIMLMGDNAPLLPAPRWHWYLMGAAAASLLLAWWYLRRRRIQ